MIGEFARRESALRTWPVMLAMIAAAAVADDRLTPLPELGSTRYRGETGGLYGNGRNDPPATQRRLAIEAIAKIQPRDSTGKPSANGKVVFMSIGMSNTTQEFSAFVRLANGDDRKRPKLVLVDAAVGGADAIIWAGGQNKRLQAGGDPWSAAEAKLKAAGVTRAQVQAAWIKQAVAGPERYGEFPVHVQALEEALAKIVCKCREQYPNLRVVFLSSRIFGGYANSKLNPEPYAYESAFAIQRVIARQVAGNEQLNCDANRGAVRAPVLLWGPYLWANGDVPRKTDGLVWRREDFREDGTHPSEKGRRKVAEQLLEFFSSDEFGKGIFAR